MKPKKNKKQPNIVRFKAVYYGASCGHKHFSRESARECGEKKWRNYGGTVHEW